MVRWTGCQEAETPSEFPCNAMNISYGISFVRLQHPHITTHGSMDAI